MFVWYKNWFLKYLLNIFTLGCGGPCTWLALVPFHLSQALGRALDGPQSRSRRCKEETIYCKVIWKMAVPQTNMTRNAGKNGRAWYCVRHACCVKSLLGHVCQLAFFIHFTSLSSSLTFYILRFLPKEYFSSPEHNEVIDPTNGMRPTTLVASHVPNESHNSFFAETIAPSFHCTSFHHCRFFI
jgi:hypothetical protein